MLSLNFARNFKLNTRQCAFLRMCVSRLLLLSCLPDIDDTTTISLLQSQSVKPRNDRASSVDLFDMQHVFAH
jgi:hypothetical protein